MGFLVVLALVLVVLVLVLLEVVVAPVVARLGLDADLVVVVVVVVVVPVGAEAEAEAEAGADLLEVELVDDLGAVLVPELAARDIVVAPVPSAARRVAEAAVEEAEACYCC